MPTVTSSRKKPARKMFIGEEATVKSGCRALYSWLLPTSAAAFATAVKADRSNAGQLVFRMPCKYLHVAQQVVTYSVIGQCFGSTAGQLVFSIYRIYRRAHNSLWSHVEVTCQYITWLMMWSLHACMTYTYKRLQL